MFDFTYRVLKHPTDYFPVLSWHKVTLIRTEKHQPGIQSFIFQKPDKLSWKAGQHGVWWFLDSPLMTKRNWRAFSVASSQHENELRFSTTFSEQPSPFKQRLLQMQPGDTLWLQGPFGEFHARKKQTLVGVAGGIGITPFRALSYEIAHGHLPQTSLSLIYSAAQEHTFKTELEEWSQKTDQLTITYTHTPDEVNTELESAFRKFGNEAYYCLSGSPGMINALKKSCAEKGITKIINDPFKGY